MQRLIESDTGTLRARASGLQHSASEARGHANRLDAVSNGANIAGDNSSVRSLRGGISKLQARLRAFADHCDRAAAILSALAQELENLEHSAQNKFSTFGSPVQGTPQYIAYEAMANPGLEITQAIGARSKAARELKRLANETPAALAEPSKLEIIRDEFGKAVGNFATDTWNGLWEVGKDTVTGAWGIAKFVGYEGTIQVFVNPSGFKESWAGVLNTAGYMATHPMDTASAVWDGVVNPELFKKDPAAWIVVTAVSLVGFKGVGKVLKTTTETAKIAKVAESLAKVRASVVQKFSGIIATRTSDFGKAILEQHPNSFVPLTHDLTELRKLYPQFPDHVWAENSANRGFRIEEVISVTWQKLYNADPLPLNTKGIDYFDRRTGTVFQVKSIDTTAPSYSGSGFTSRINSYIDDLSNYNGSDPGSKGVYIEPWKVQHRQLVVAVPEGATTEAQTSALVDLIQRAKDNGIEMKIVEVPQ